jgi:hypothetical protein
MADAEREARKQTEEAERLRLAAEQLRHAKREAALVGYTMPYYTILYYTILYYTILYH